MATAAREEKQKQKQPYEGLGGGGKFRKTPFRRSTQTTPYDRPPTALRNPITAANGGWISKLVDPAQRLITSSAHRLFSTVFRKRLPPPPLTEVNHGAAVKDKEEVAMDPLGVQKGAIDQSAGPSTTTDGEGFTELEQILEQKTFTRTEIDRLTALLHSRNADTPIENQEKRSEAIPSKPVVSHDRKEEFPKTPVQDKNGIESRIVSTPVVNTNVLDEDVASPAELAKAYMGSTSKVSPSMLGWRSQALHEDSPILSSVPFPSKPPIMSLVPRTSGHVGAPENGFVTPRSRGRSAIYSMARTPYSRVRTASTFKGAGSTVDAYGGPSSSQSVWEQSQPSGSKQGALKRRISVLDNDIGSVGPIRRIRQKPNLLSSRGLSFPGSSSTASILGTRMSSKAAQNPSSSTQKPLSLGETRFIQTKALSENGDNAVPRTSFSAVPSKSSEMAFKILEQLDKLVSPKEKSSNPKLLTAGDKSPTKLSPSMLRGQALKSLEDVDSSKFLDSVHNSNNKLDASFDQLIPDAQDFISQKQDKIKENGSLRIAAPSDNSTTIVNGVDSTTDKKDIVPVDNTAVSAASNFIDHPPQKKRAFKMSAHEDFLELDDDSYSNGVASDSLADGRGKVDTSLTERKSVANATVTLEKPPVVSEHKPPASSPVNQKTDLRTFGGSVLAENSTIFSPSASSSSMTVLPSMVASQPSFMSDKVALPKESNSGTPIFNFGGKDTSTKDSDVAQPQFTRASSPAVRESVDAKFGAFSHLKPESSSSVSTIAAGATNSVRKPLESDKTDNENNSHVGGSLKMPETALSSAVSSSATSIFSFGTPPNNSNLSNGSSPLFSSSTPSDFNNLTSQNPSGSITFAANTNSGNNIGTTTFFTTSSSNISSSAPAPLFSAAPSNFESSTASTAVTPIPVNSSLESLEGKNKQDKGFSNLSSTPFGGTSAASASTGSNIYVLGGGAATSTANNQSQSSTLFGVGSGSSGSIPSAQALPAGTGVASFSQSAPTQPGSSASSPSFGLAGNTALSSGSSVFLSTSAAKLFSSGASTVLGSSTSSLEANPISSSATPSLFGSSWQPAKAPIFASTFNSTSLSSGFPFGPSSTSAATNGASIGSGASSASAATTNGAPMIFGTSSASAATTNSVPTVFGTPSASAATTNSVPMIFGTSSASAATTNSAPTVFGTPSASAATTNSMPMFGSSNGAPSTSFFSFNSSASNTAPSQPAFANPSPAFAFSSAPAGNNDQMSMEDSMAEDTVQASTPTASMFGQQPLSTPQSGFVFGAGGPSVTTMATPFQFASQQNLANPQNPSLFQASGSFSLTEGGKFSVGSMGGSVDKSNRKYVKVSKLKQRKK